MAKYSVELIISQPGREAIKLCELSADAAGLKISGRKANGIILKTGFSSMWANPATIEVTCSEKSSGGCKINIAGSIFGWGPQTGEIRKLVANYRNEIEQRSRSVEMQNTQSKTSSDPVEKLKQLSQMLEAGLITEDEYNQKKSEILGNI
jgi:hypothetical protein